MMYEKGKWMWLEGEPVRTALPVRQKEDGSEQQTTDVSLTVQLPVESETVLNGSNECLHLQAWIIQKRKGVRF